MKAERKALPSRVCVKDLPENERFQRLDTRSKHFIDTIKMIAYRAETAMAYILREVMPRTDEARSLLRSLYQSEADLIPGKEDGTLLVRLHHQASRSSDQFAAHLSEELSKTETCFPGTNLCLVYKLGSSGFP